MYERFTDRARQWWRFITRADSQFPKNVRGHWYCGEWYLHLVGLRDRGVYKEANLDAPEHSPVTDNVAFNPWRTGHVGSDSSELIIA